MKDRFMAGFISGVIGGTIASLIDIFLVNNLSFGTTRYIDFASVIELGKTVEGWGEAIFAQLGQSLFSGFLGIGYAYLLKWTGGNYPKSKALIYAAGTWFLIFASVRIGRIPNLPKNVPLSTSMENYIAALIFGLITSYVFTKLNKDEAQSG